VTVEEELGWMKAERAPTAMGMVKRAPTATVMVERTPTATGMVERAPPATASNCNGDGDGRGSFDSNEDGIIGGGVLASLRRRPTYQGSEHFQRRFLHFHGGTSGDGDSSDSGAGGVG
jgi:hypothetical protein